MKSHHAFTLIETLVALSISIILIAISLLSLKHLYEKSQDEKLLAELLESIELAKFEAQTKHTPVSISKAEHDHWHEGYFIFFDKKADGIVHDKQQLIAIRQATSSHGVLHWRSFPSYRKFLHIAATGLTHSDNGTFWYCHAESAVWAVIVNKQGRAYAIRADEYGKINDDHGKPLLC